MVSAVVLAAGLSRRMENKNKLLLPYRGKTILETTLGNILASGIEDIVVVTGRDADQVTTLLQPLQVSVVYNPSFTNGLTSSIQTGVAQATGTGFMICLADMVLITPEEYGLLAVRFDEQVKRDPQCIGLPVYQGRKGNPVVFSAAWRETITAHLPLEGCREIVQSHPDNVYRVEMTTDHVLQDLDYPGDYLALTGA